MTRYISSALYLLFLNRLYYLYCLGVVLLRMMLCVFLVCCVHVVVFSMFVKQKYVYRSSGALEFQFQNYEAPEFRTLEIQNFKKIQKSKALEFQKVEIPKVRSSGASNLQNFKIPEVKSSGASKLQNFNIAKLWSSRVLELQNFKAPERWSSGTSKFQDSGSLKPRSFNILKFHKSEAPELTTSVVLNF